MPDRVDVLVTLAQHLDGLRPGHPVRVGIDGICGVGKSTLARDLVAALRDLGREAVHVDSDGFHHGAAVRRRNREDSARGYYDDAYDFDSLARLVLKPLGPGGDRRIATAVHSMDTDEVIGDQWATVATEAVAVFDCTFLQRPPLRDLWDVVIFLDASREVALERGAHRDAEAMGGLDAARHAFEARYMAACDIYRAEVRPRESATIVVAHDDPAHPEIVRWPTRSPGCGQRSQSCP